MRTVLITIGSALCGFLTGWILHTLLSAPWWLTAFGAGLVCFVLIMWLTSLDERRMLKREAALSSDQQNPTDEQDPSPADDFPAPR